MILQWVKYFLIYMSVFCATYGLVTVSTFAYNTVNQTFETRGAISRVDFEGYSCFVGKGKMECFKNE